MTRVRKMIIVKVAVRATKEMMTAKVSGSKKWIDNKSDDGGKDNSNQCLNLIRIVNVNTMHLNQSKFPRLYGCNFQFNLFFLINIRRKFNFDHDLISILFLLLILNNEKFNSIPVYYNAAPTFFWWVPTNLFVFWPI